jgi:hypothetical protein
MAIARHQPGDFRFVEPLCIGEYVGVEEINDGRHARAKKQENVGGLARSPCLPARRKDGVKAPAVLSHELHICIDTHIRRGP